MTARAHLSEEAEQEERDDREKLQAVLGKLRELLDRRALLLGDLRKLSDEQDALHDARRPRDEEVERIHREYLEIGQDLAGIRGQRDEARRQAAEALAAVREFRASLPRGERAHPEAIRREIADLERRQQTTALPLAEENALIDRTRRAAHALVEAERTKGERDEQERRLKDLEAALAGHRTAIAKFTDEFARLKVERDRRMESIRGRLVEAGSLVAEIRVKAKARSALLERLRLLGGSLAELEREADRLQASSRSRRQEARKAIVDYQRSVRGPVDGETARSRAADDKLEELLKRGKVVLRG